MVNKIIKMYEPREDSFFMAQQVEAFCKNLEGKNISFLDMGCGTGILSEAAIRAGIPREKVMAVDIDEEAVSYVKNKGINAKVSDLFSNLGDEKFDLIVFNPPYLPASRYDRAKDTTGGKYGDETILRFLRQAKKYLSENGKILLLLSSLTPKTRIERLLKSQGLKLRKLSEKKLFFETLSIWLISHT